MRSNRRGNNTRSDEEGFPPVFVLPSIIVHRVDNFSHSLTSVADQGLRLTRAE